MIKRQDAFYFIFHLHSFLSSLQEPGQGQGQREGEGEEAQPGALWQKASLPQSWQEEVAQLRAQISPPPQPQQGEREGQRQGERAVIERQRWGFKDAFCLYCVTSYSLGLTCSLGCRCYCTKNITVQVVHQGKLVTFWLMCVLSRHNKPPEQLRLCLLEEWTAFLHKIFPNLYI